MSILTVNVGSSSVRLTAHGAAGECLVRTCLPRVEEAPARRIADFLTQAALETAPRIVAHRVVHGGDRLTTPCRIDAVVEREIARLGELAPLHNPAALKWIGACREALDVELPQIAAFDTAFFADLPAVARTYALPESLCPQGGAPASCRRFGFHGIAHHYLWREWARTRTPDAGGRMISLQLGSGCSIAAVHDGMALDTSMGFSPLEGLVMATRAGDLDPGLLLYLQRRLGLSPGALEQVLNEQGGLRGLSGTSGDMRELLASREARARLAVEVFCYRARKYVGAYLAVLGGVEAIVFGGGVGEHAPAVRAGILQGLEWAGIALDPARNTAALGEKAPIGAAHGRVQVWVIPVDEAQMLAEAARRFLTGESEGGS